MNDRLKLLAEALNQGKLNRLQKKLELNMRQLKAKSNTDPQELNRIVFALDAIREISENPELVDGKVSGKNNKFLAMLRKEELALRVEILKSEPDLQKITDGYLRMKSLARLTSDPSMYDSRTDINENANRSKISRPSLHSEFAQDLQAMYGEALKPGKEDIESYEQAREYLNEEKSESKVNAAGNYTKPGLRKRIFKRIMAGTKGGDPGEWSARKAQLLAREYKKAGGGYKD